MGTCKYCVGKTSPFSKAHIECKEKHSDELRGLEQDLRVVLSNIIGDSSRFRANLPTYKTTNFLSDYDIITVFDKGLRDYTVSLPLRWP